MGRVLAHRLLAPALVAVLAAVPLACGSSESASLAPTEAIAQAAEETAAQESARVSFTAETEVGGQATSFSGEGAFSGQRGHLVMDLGQLGQQGMPGGEMEIVFDELVLYMRFPPELAEQLPGQRPWVRMDLQALGEEEGVDLGQLMQLGQSDPTQTLEYLRGASDDFERVGTEEVRGVETTHYRGTLDLEKVAEQAPEAARESYRRAIEESGESTIPFEVWIDGDSLARRMRYEQRLPGQGGTMTMTMEFYDYGADVEIEPPSDDEVTDLSRILQGGGA